MTQTDKVHPGPRRNESWLPVLVERRGNRADALDRYEARQILRGRLRRAGYWLCVALVPGLVVAGLVMLLRGGL
jgi:hypothetical protein